MAKDTDADFKISFRAAQLEIVLSQALDLLTLLARRQIRPQARIRLRLAHPRAQRLGMDREIGSDVRDRTATLERKRNAPLEQLLWVPSSAST